MEHEENHCCAECAGSALAVGEEHAVPSCSCEICIAMVRGEGGFCPCPACRALRREAE